MPTYLCLLFASMVYIGDAFTNHSYTAAVLEHATQGNWSRDEPEEFIRTNLAFFANAAKVAKSKGADLIVFPEYGIFPFANRQSLKKILEQVPDPKSDSSNPCEQAVYANSLILRTLSCIARNNSITLVANVGDIEKCGNETDCPEDGYFHFNANVAIDSNGTVIGRYRKERLFFEEGMDLPKVPQDPTFQTDFGTFAMFVCFDIVFEKIAKVAKLGVEAVLLPTMWIDPAPLMTSVQLWQSWSISNNVTFIAANVQIPGYSAVGSGIFNGGDKVYTYNPDGLSKLVVAEVGRRGHAVDTRNLSESSITIIAINGTEDYKKDGNKVPDVCSKKILGETKDIYKDYRCLDTNTSEYTFVKLNGTHDYIEACNNGLCCHLNYTASEIEDNFFFGVFNGTYNMFNRYFWCEENCLLLKCDSFENHTCSTFPMRSRTKFQNVHIVGHFEAEYLYPTVLGSGIRLISTRDWSSSNHYGRGVVHFNSHLGKELVVAGLHGRCYDRDPPYIR